MLTRQITATHFLSIAQSGRLMCCHAVLACTLPAFTKASSRLSGWPTSRAHHVFLPLTSPVSCGSAHAALGSVHCPCMQMCEQHMLAAAHQPQAVSCPRLPSPSLLQTASPAPVLAVGRPRQLLGHRAWHVSRNAGAVRHDNPPCAQSLLPVQA